MTSDLILTLQITFVGMGLVFGAIVLLWVVIAMLMRIAAGRSLPAEPMQDRPDYAAIEIEEEREQKRKAAIVAVAIALGIDKQAPHEFPLPPTAIVSAWQAVMRANNIRRRGSAR
jgi:Na+-transporting methylmalonyl-CoA/oxaloacetate decarboxylase gamma subunit